MKFSKLTIQNSEELLFGTAPHPVRTRRGLVIGGGRVYPELNFTLPPMEVSKRTLPELKGQYGEIVRGALTRAVELQSSGLVLEFETLLEMTLDPDIGVELVKVMNEICDEFHRKSGLKSEIRLTPNDTRDFSQPPLMRTSPYLDRMLELFERGADAGGDLLSIESTGGKEVHDEALLNGDIRQCLFALTVLGVRDMRFLWKKIVDIARRKNRIAGGDTACGFGNTAMVLAEKRYIPRVFAAVVRAITAVRTLVAVEMGATGPDKDCGYEGPFLKAITGIPISMEGKTAACAHFSPVGNVSEACCDLWSNESVQNVKLLGGMAPIVSLEQLEYDVRLLNAAIADGPVTVRKLQQLLVESDIHLDPQALILGPESVLAISAEIVGAKNDIEAGKRAGLKALEIIGAAHREGRLKLDDREAGWVARLNDELGAVPTDESKLVEEVLPQLDRTKFVPGEYGL